MKNIINITELLKGICIIGLYYLLTTLLSIPFTFFITNENRGLLSLILVILLALIFSLIYIKSIKKDIKEFKLDYIKIGFNYWVKGLFIMIVSSFILSIFNLGLTTNEETNRQLISLYPITEIISAVIFAPILEELVFRRSFKNFTNNKHIYAFTTGLIFGGIHIISSLSNPINLLFLIPYSSMGIAFGYAYFKTDNICTTIYIHSFHNLITIIELILIGGLL